MDARRADLALGVMLGASLALIVVLALWSSELPLSLLSGGVMLSVWVGVFLFFVASFSLKFALTEIQVPVERAGPLVANALRRTGGQVSTEGGSVVV